MGVYWGQIDPRLTPMANKTSSLRGKRQIPGQSNTVRKKVQMSKQEEIKLVAAATKARTSFSMYVINAALDKADRDSASSKN